MWFFGRRHLWSPIIFAIFLTCIHNVYSRHRIRHHRDRFKRQQGAGLYLPASYVYDGEAAAEAEAGPWEAWSAASTCSRTCGGGVATEMRQCAPGYRCQGPSARHFSCNTQDCPDRADFRAQQCAEFDSTPFNGITYQWIPYVRTSKPCELNCMPRGERFYYRHRDRVADGTRCADDALDVCVQGACQPVGCDMLLGSPVREDACRVCGGNGSTCYTIAETFTKHDLQVGYNDFLLIPTGATNILIESLAPSTNYLAVRNTSGHYYLNGNFRIDFPRALDFAGCKFNYERSPKGFSGLDRVTCLGPIDESIIVALLYQEPNVGVRYEYSLPTNVHPGSLDSETYAWTFDQFGECSRTCGGGVRARNVTCAGRRTLEPVDGSLCEAGARPAAQEACGEGACAAQWEAFEWGECSEPCGAGGVQRRAVACQRMERGGLARLVAEGECAKGGPKPEEERGCNEGKVCAKWHEGPWRPCDKLCGEGVETRRVRCYRDEGGQIELLPDGGCARERPAEERKCNLRPCEGVDWITTEWSGCDKCGLTNETRKTQCASINGEIYSEEICAPEKKPKTVQPCKPTKENCEYNWYASQWSECSANCGIGVQTRTLFCGVIGEDKKVEKVDNDKCDSNRTFETLRNCTAETEQCPGEWFSGPWSDCSKPCGGGERNRQVVCLKDLMLADVTECGSDTIIFRQEDCNTHSCTDDTILPTDVTKSIDESEGTTVSDTSDFTMVTESASFTTEDDSEYEIVPDDECEDGEWLDDEQGDEGTTDEMGDEVLGTGTESSVTSSGQETSISDDGLMQSDAPTSSVSDSETVSGSGDDDTGSTDPIGTTFVGSTLEEGSGGSEPTETTIQNGTETEGLSSLSLVTEPSGVSNANSDSSTDSLSSTNLSSSSDGLTDTSSNSTDSSSPASSTDSFSETSTESGTSESSTEGGTEDTSSSSSTDDSSPTSEVSSTDDSSATDFSSSSTTEFATSDVSATELSLSTVETTTTTDEEEENEIIITFKTANYSKSTKNDFSESTSESSSISTETSDLTTETTESSSIEFNATDSTTFESTETSTDSSGTSTISSESSASFESTITPESTSESSTFSSESSTLVSESSSDASASTTEYDIWSTTPSDAWSTTELITEIFATRKPRMCKRKLRKSCKSTAHGCCWDKVTPAKGPFDEGCPAPKTCKETVFGCCEDGVSPSLGRNFKGCPPSRCNETLFGCCPDKKTPAEDRNGTSCPPLPPACLKARWGCCKGNATAAKGPKQKGCAVDKPKVTPPPPAKGTTPKLEAVTTNCTQSRFACCPDNKTAAEGPNFKGCKVPCSSTTFGCCADGATAAHGPAREGCCLQGPFGCCPDNVLEARGPNFDGCGCQYSPYRCCPDNATAARGPQNEGCGCAHTPHGCCPDNYTPAAGPEYAGCLCHTFQFGCCPDGVTAAKGAHQQGCGCRSTPHGCCSDERTPAQGAAFAGCGCAASKHGCCPDGATEAAGEEFEGCADVPPDRQASCAQPKDNGPCRNYTVKFFFDMEYGACSRFWYGGCEGGGNRFRSKDECDAVCVRPEGRERCGLPKVAGPCQGYDLSWYYDGKRRTCAQFVYGGCFGNNNRFEKREDCMALCAHDESVDACEQKRDEGPCRGRYERWYFEKESGRCERFAYGGCKANGNNFATEEACKQQCARPDRKKDLCLLPRAEGSCMEKLPRWRFDTPDESCRPFYYSGCGGNDNNFVSREACEADCPKVVEKDDCHLPAEVGTCANYTIRWYFDTRERSCRQFYYGGCDANANNFETEPDCLARCTPSTAAPPTAPPQQPPQPPSTAFTREDCLRPSDAGPCSTAEPRYFYDRADGVCKSFTYGGCAGNRNNFATLNDCLQRCGAAQDICSLPPVVGPCDSDYAQFYYEPGSDSCREFKYGGCGGNYNRFENRSQCESRCKRTPPTQAPPTPAPESTMCDLAPHPGNCTESLTAYYFDGRSRMCAPFAYSGCGGNANRFGTEEQCERQCGQYRNDDVCGREQDAGPCREYVIKYYYDAGRGRCGQFYYGGCEGNGNRFSTVEECEAICVAREEDRNVTSNAVGPADHPCQIYFDECTTLRCQYGVEAYVDANECQRCQCLDPCRNATCAPGTQCALEYNANRTAASPAEFVVACRPTHKDGFCRPMEAAHLEGCDDECRSDADCPSMLKCCVIGCAHRCTMPGDAEVPAEIVTQSYRPVYTYPPVESQYSPPQVDVVKFKPEAQGLLGDVATLTCAVTGSPTPGITWKKGDLLIDGKGAKYRIKLDQSLQIITLHETDSGIYLCTADNNIGEPITREIKLEVIDDGAMRPASVLEPEDEPKVIATLNAPTTLNCLALGWPRPAVTWWNNDKLLPMQTSQYVVRQDYSLLINSVRLQNLGIYTCQAYNGVGKAASWSVMVQARGPYHSTNPADAPYLKYIVNPPEAPHVAPTPATLPPQVYYPNEVEPEPQISSSQFVPVRTRIQLDTDRFATSNDISIPCEVEGYPVPQVQWYKDGVPVNPSERFVISENHKLTILKANKGDSGLYQCEAANIHSKSASSHSILVEGVHPNCKDNRYFANCNLIVQGNFCKHKHYAKFCCKSCTEAGLLPSVGNHLD